MLLSPTQFLRIEVQQAVYHYFQLGAELVATDSDFSDWLTGLPAPLYALCRAAGFGAERQNLSFRRFLLEVRGHSLHEYLADQLSPEAFAHWLMLDEHGSGPDANRWLLTYQHHLAQRHQEWLTSHSRQQTSPGSHRWTAH